MSTLKVNSLINGGSAIDLPNGLEVGGNPIVQGYTESATEPSSPVTGDFWWDTANEVLYQYLNGEFKEISTIIASLDISSFSYDSISYSLSGLTVPTGLAFNSDGTVLFVGNNSSDSVYSYPLSTAYDLSTISAYTASFNAGSQSSNPSHFQFSPDGTKMFVLDYTNDNVYQYTLSTAWDLNTTSYDNVSYVTDLIQPWGLTFSADGSKFFIASFTDNIYQFSCASPWDVSSVTAEGSFNIASEETTPRFVIFSANGLQMFAGGSNFRKVYQYSLSTAWDVTTATYDNKSLDLSAQDTTPQGIAFNADYTKLYICGQSTDSVYQYSIGL